MAWMVKGAVVQRTCPLPQPTSATKFRPMCCIFFASPVDLAWRNSVWNPTRTTPKLTFPDVPKAVDRGLSRLGWKLWMLELCSIDFNRVVFGQFVLSSNTKLSTLPEASEKAAQRSPAASDTKANPRLCSPFVLPGGRTLGSPRKIQL